MSISRLLPLLLHPRQQQQQDRKRMKKRWKDFSFFKRFLLVVRDGMFERESARPRVRLPFYKSSWACNPLFSTSLVHFHLLVKSLCTITITTTTTTTTTSSCTRLLEFVLAGPRIRASVGVLNSQALCCVYSTHLSFASWRLLRTRWIAQSLSKLDTRMIDSWVCLDGFIPSRVAVVGIGNRGRRMTAVEEANYFV